MQVRNSQQFSIYSTIMKISTALTITILSIFALFLQVESKKECGFECIEFDWGFPNDTIGDLVLSHLKKAGPSDGVCLKKDKWILNGTDFGLPSKCACVDIPTDKKIKPNEGKRCPDICIASPEETPVEYWTRCHDAVKSTAPENGWCSKGQIKWIIKGERIGRPNEKSTCHCIGGYEFFSQDVKCVDVPSASYSASDEL